MLAMLVLMQLAFANSIMKYALKCLRDVSYALQSLHRRVKRICQLIQLDRHSS